MRTSPKPLLIAISVTSIQNEPYIGSDGRMAKSANIRGKSEDADVCFDLRTGLLNQEQIQRCILLQDHGSTVVEVPDNWRYGYGQSDGWKDFVIKQAMDRVAALYQDGEGAERMAGYDAELAQKILEIVNQAHPSRVSGMDLKRELRPEPSDKEFYTALDALEIDGLVKLASIRSGIYNEIGDVAFVWMTADGRKYINNKNNPIPTVVPVLQGNQYINNGNAGAMGPNSTGTINYYQQWEAIEKTVDLSIVAVQLEQLRVELQEVANTREDHKQLGQIAEAEEHAEKKDGPKVLSILSTLGTTILTVATKIGADEVVKLIEQHWKH